MSCSTTRPCPCRAHIGSQVPILMRMLRGLLMGKMQIQLLPGVLLVGLLMKWKFLYKFSCLVPEGNDITVSDEFIDRDRWQWTGRGLSLSHDCIDLSVQRPTHPKEETHQTDRQKDILPTLHITDNVLVYLLLESFIRKPHLTFYHFYSLFHLSGDSLHLKCGDPNPLTSSCRPPTPPNRGSRSSSFRASRKQRTV